MKKLYTFSALLLAFNTAIAQPTFTSSDFLSVGASDSFSMGVITNTYVTGMAMESNTSTNHSWDFVSDILYLAGAFAYSCTTPVPSMYSYLPPETNLRESCFGGGIENLYQKVADTVYVIRSGTSISSGSFIFPKLRYITFPLSFGDSMGSRQLLYADTGKVIPSVTRTHSYKYDGFGTVKLPWGSYPNVFRIKMTTRDSSHILANYITTYSNYLFFEQGGGVPIARLTSSITKDSVSHAYTLIANKTAAVPNAITEIGATHQISIYPNPANDQLFINSDNAGPLSFSITDMAGRKLNAGKVPVSNAPVSISDLAKGLYLISVFDNDEHLICNSKFVKQ